MTQRSTQSDNTALPRFASAYRRPIAGNPEMDLVSTSHVERLNATTRLHVKRLSRLTLAFSKKFENFQAAVALHFAYYNFVRRHNTLRCTPAMAAGIEPGFWSVGQLVGGHNMTSQSKRFIELTDILALNFVCKDCGAAISVSPKEYLRRKRKRDNIRLPHLRTFVGASE